MDYMEIENTATQNRMKITIKGVITFVFGTVFSLSLIACDSMNQKSVGTYQAKMAGVTANDFKRDASSTENVAPDYAKKNRGYLAPEQVIPKLVNPVNDFTNTLNTKERKQLNRKLQTLFDEGLLQAGIVIVPTTDGMPIFDYGMQLFNGWRLGSAEQNNGLLIVVAVDDREMYILTGSGIEDTLTNERVGEVISDVILPSFKQLEYAQGLSQGVDALADIMRK